ncbi:MAG: ADP-ribosylglycohydrolase family protein [Acidimicrobiales bacterium]|nr:ADP-ribosylglycohydrolase family protein [Acidimicrobiales bacterium]
MPRDPSPAGVPADDPLLDRFRGALVGVAVGDALGSAFEGMPGPIPTASVDRHLSAPRRAHFTDDTAMTIAVAESLLHVGGLDLDHLAGTFAASHEREPGRGYSSATSRLLRDIAAGANWSQRAAAQFRGQGSLGNGASMRASPFGLWADEPRRAGELAGSAATITHTHPLAIDGAAAIAAAVSHAVRHPSGDPAGVLATALSVTNTAEMVGRLDDAGALADAPAAAVADALGTGITALEAVPAAICCHLHHPDSLVDTVRFAISLGGDTDTIAAMATAITGAAVGASAVPLPWAQRCEGVDHLVELAERIHARRRP